MADERLLAGEAEPARACAGGDDQRAGMNFAGGGVQLDGVRVEVDRVEMRQLKGGAEADGLLLHVVDQFGALDAIGPAGKVFDQRGDGKLAAGFVAFEHQRFRPARAV